jgi:UPF0716 protein FxsA
MAILLVVLFIVIPIAELYVIIQIGGSIGVLPTLGLLILDSIIGAALLRSQGRSAWERFNAALGESRVPGREVFDGAMIILGGALLLTPGFITDLFGLALLLPPSRAVVRRGVAWLAKRHLIVGWMVSGPGSPRSAGGPGPTPPAGPPRNRGPRDYDVEGTATEVRDVPELPAAGNGHG